MADKPKRKLTRRKFLLATVVVAGGGFALSRALRDHGSLATGPDVLEPNPLLQITPDGQIIFQLDKVEMGQGTMTGLATIIAEELDVDPTLLDVRKAPVLPFFQRPQQTTGGSESIYKSWDLLRETGAAARAMLLEAAGEHWDVRSAELETTGSGYVRNPATGEELSYGDLAAVAATRSVPSDVALKDPSEFRWIGKDVPRLDALPKVNGSAVYGIDVQPEGVLIAVIARIPEMRAVLSDYDASKAEAMPGVRGIVALFDGVAVVADDFWAASQAAKQIELSWEPGPAAEASDREIAARQFEILDTLQESTLAESEVVVSEDASFIEGDYTTPYLAHAPMEPLNATVHVRADGAEVWAPTQAPDGAREMACLATGFDRADVYVHTTWIGGGFGRRFINDFVFEAATIAKEFDVPVKLIWPREQDIQRGYLRQQTAHRMQGAVDSDGNIQLWRHMEVAASAALAMSGEMFASFLPEWGSAQGRKDFGDWAGGFMSETPGAFQAMDGATDSLYDIDNFEFELETYNTPVVISIWRSVGASYTGFVIESFMDELAHAAGADPMQFRLDKVVPDTPADTILTMLRDVSNWGNQPAGRYQGVAVFECFGTHVGQVAEVSVEDDDIRVHKVYCVVDCGRAVNPDIVRAQMESCVIFGLTAALLGEINIHNGRVQQSNFHDYQMLRMQDSPEVEVHIVPSDKDSTGVGEPGLPVIAPAVANAVYAATGKRLRNLPLKL